MTSNTQDTVRRALPENHGSAGDIGAAMSNGMMIPRGTVFSDPSISSLRAHVYIYGGNGYRDIILLDIFNSPRYGDIDNGINGVSNSLGASS